MVAKEVVVIKVQVRKRDIEMTDVLRTHVERRLRLALSRFADRIGRVIVRLSQAAGDRSGSYKRCQIEVGLRSRQVQVEDIDGDLFAAVNHATDRVSRSVARALEREATTAEGAHRGGTAQRVTRHPP
jgi:ribosomal subunit interface protein